MNFKKLRPILDVIILVVFFTAAISFCYQYWFTSEDPAPQADITLIDAPAGIDLKEMLRLCRDTQPAIALRDWEPSTLSNRWEYITIHHSATLSGNLAIFDKQHHLRGMENGMAYHFVIGNGHGSPDGLVEVGSRWQKQLDGGHLRGAENNAKSIGICLVGDFTKIPPTPKQIASLKALLLKLQEITNLDKSRITSHKKTPGQATACPGLLPVKSISENLRPQTLPTE